jgi:hypothetical protein
MKKTIIQASHAKSTLENLNIKKNYHTIFSLDIKSFYASVTCNLVEMTINCFGKDLQMKDKLMIRECLKLIHFGMGNTLITFKKISTLSTMVTEKSTKQVLRSLAMNQPGWQIW